ncbi:hypothetical protein BH10ACI1_BH10ACI1_31480 [soil metagenome]
MQRQIDWLTCLINAGDEKIIYDLRIIGEPRPENFTEGVLHIGLLCRMNGVSKRTARLYALELLRLCQTYFEDEYEFSAVEDEKELNFFRLPFEIKDAFQVMRRSEIAQLDLLFNSAKPQMGFKAKNVSRKSEKENRIFHVHPFTISNAKINNLLKLMLWQKKPLAVSFRLLPTGLSREEILFLIRQISHCENYSKSLPAHNEEAGIFSLQTQAQIFHSHLTRSLGILKDNAALLVIEIAGEQKLPQTFIDVLGSYLTESSGGRGGLQNINAYLSGGYDYRRIEQKSLKKISAGWKNPAIDLEIKDKKIPPEALRLRHLFDSTEAVLSFRFPSPGVEEITGIKCKSYRTQLFKENVKSGQLIGYSRHNNLRKDVKLSRSDRRRHIYAVGQTGTGKTTMFESMILDDMRNGEGLCVIDPHGDLVEKLLKKIPEDRAGDVVIFDPGDLERPIGFNILEYESEAQKHFLIQELLSIIERLMAKFDPNFAGPLFYQHSRMVLQLVMSNPQKIGTLAQLYQVFSSNDFYKRFLPLAKPDKVLQTFIDETLSKTDYTKIGFESTSLGGWISSKYEPFIGDPMLRNIFGQPYSTIDLKSVMNDGKILLVNLSKGRMGELNARFFGMVLIAKLQAAAMSRANMPENRRRDFYLYVDEFQNLATQNFSVLLAEARKYRLNLILTNQFITQVSQDIRDAITGNVGTIISFRVGSTDAEFLERDFLPTFNKFDLMNLPNFNTYVSTLVDGQVVKPFSLRIVSDFSKEQKTLARQIRSTSRKKYGINRREVEQIIEESLTYDPTKQNDSFYDVDNISDKCGEIIDGIINIDNSKLLNRSIETLEFSVRTYNCLKKSNIKTIKNLINRNEKDLLEINYFSTKSLNEVKEVLKEMDLYLQK